MPGKLDTLSPMAKETAINMRVSDDVKRAIELAAQEQGRTVTNYILWTLAQSDARIAQAQAKR